MAKLLAFDEHNPFDVDLGPFEILLDSGWLNTTILDEMGKGDAGNFSADRIEAGESDFTRGFVHADVNSGNFFKDADIAAVLADDPTLGFFVGNGDSANGEFGDVVGGAGAHGVDEDFSGDLISFGFGFFFGFFDGTGNLTF